MCINLFIVAEVHIRNMERSGVPKEILNCFLNKVYDEYSKIYADFEENSSQLINDVHLKLEKINYNLENNKFERIIRDEELAPSTIVHKGMIHYLANEKKTKNKRVVWGDNWEESE